VNYGRSGTKDIVFGYGGFNASTYMWKKTPLMQETAKLCLPLASTFHDSLCTKYELPSFTEEGRKEVPEQ